MQGVNTDAVLGVVLRELKQQDKLKLAFHMEPYEGNAVHCLCRHCCFTMPINNAAVVIMTRSTAATAAPTENSTNH